MSAEHKPHSSPGEVEAANEYERRIAWTMADKVANVQRWLPTDDVSTARRDLASLVEQYEGLQTEVQKWREGYSPELRELEELREQFEALHRKAESVVDSWLLWQNDVDIAHLDHACSELNALLQSNPANEQEIARRVATTMSLKDVVDEDHPASVSEGVIPRPQGPSTDGNSSVGAAPSETFDPASRPEVSERGADSTRTSASRGASRSNPRSETSDPSPASSPEPITEQLARAGLCPNCGGTGEDYNWFVGEPTKCLKCDGSGEAQSPAKEPE
jgi:hypothetical protein